MRKIFGAKRCVRANEYRVDEDIKVYAFEILENSLQRQREQRHEYQNHINCIYYLAEMGQYVQLREYVNSLRENSDFYGGNICRTNHNIIDAILRAKYSEFKEKNIFFSVEADDLSGLVLSNEDVVDIMMNLLNYTLKRGEKPGSLKHVILKINKRSGMIYICLKYNCSNHSEHTSRNEKKHQQDEEQSEEWDSIKKCVSRCGGNCKIIQLSNLFEVDIRIPTKHLTCKK